MAEKGIISEVYNQFGPRFWRWKKGRNPHLIRIAFNALNMDIDIIEIFVKYGFYKNRSVALRNYLRDGIKKDLKLIKKLEKFKDLDIKTLGLILAKEKIEKIKQIRDLNNKLIDPLQEGSIQEKEIIEKLEEIINDRK